MQQALRDYFDAQLEAVLRELPPCVLNLLDEVPLIVDDYPSRELRRRVGIRRRDQLCGLYTGIPLTQRSVEQGGHPTDVIHLFRTGILAAAAANYRGQLQEQELRRQIRLTILHEFGHLHGMDEAELEELGY